MTAGNLNMENQSTNNLVGGIKKQQQQQQQDQSQTKKVVSKKSNEAWDKFDVNQWRAAMFQTRGYFADLYKETPEFVRELIQRFKAKSPENAAKKIRLIEVGSGTGEFLFALLDDVDFTVGVEFNPKFVDFCNERKAAEYPNKNCEYVVGDAQNLVEVLQQSGTGPQKNEFVIIACVNNTFGIMPPEVCTNVYKEIFKMMDLDRENTAFLAGYWDGDHFGNSVQHFYGGNPVLCGDIKGAKLDFENHLMTTASGYTTRWTSPVQAYDRLSNLGFVCQRIEARSRGVLVEAQLPLKETTALKERQLNTDSDKVAQDYYDSKDAFLFYTHVWGGDNIHIGAYDECATLGVDDKPEQVKLAAMRILEILTTKIDIKHDWKVMDMGSALGGASRYMAQTYGCDVLGIDLSKRECEMNMQKTIRAGLCHKVDVKCCSFCDTGEQSGDYDLVISEDSFLHAGPFRGDAVKEAARCLKPGGYFVFSDILEADECDDKHKHLLDAIHARINLQNMGSVNFYKSVAEKHGLKFLSFEPMLHHLKRHYSTIQSVLREKTSELLSLGVSEEYISKMDQGLSKWVTGADHGVLNYGIFVFQKPECTIQDLALKAEEAAQKAIECATMAEKLAQAAAAQAASSSSSSSN